MKSKIIYIFLRNEKNHFMAVFCSVVEILNFRMYMQVTLKNSGKNCTFIVGNKKKERIISETIHVSFRVYCSCE